MKTIWKYDLQFSEYNNIDIPKNAEILTIQLSNANNRPCMWVLVEPSDALESRTFELVGTGMKMHEDEGFEKHYIGT